MLRKITIFLALILAVSCKSTDVQQEESATVRVSLNTDSLTIVTSKAAPTIEEFALRIENTRGENLKEWTSVSEVPEYVKMVPGSYRFVAYNGAIANLPDWGARYWQGEHKFAITAGELVEAAIVVKLGVVQVLVNFDSSFDKYYSSYSSDVRTTTPKTPEANFLNYTKLTEGQSGSFLPGTLRLRLRLTSKTDGKEYEFSPPTPIGKTLAAEIRTVNLSINETKGYPTLQVTLDETVSEYDVDMTKLPPSYLPKLPPRIRSLGFDITSQDQMQTLFNQSQGMRPAVEKLAAAIQAPAGLKSVRILAISPALRDLWGGVSVIDLVGVTTEQRRLLNSCGFVWDEQISTVEGAAKATAKVEVRFDALFGQLEARAQDGTLGTDYSFEIQAEDIFLQSGATPISGGTTTTRFLIPLKLLPPVYSMTEPSDGNVWASGAEFDLNYAANIAGAEPYIEVRKSGDAMWSRPEQTFIQTAKGLRRQMVAGLTPATQYSFRAAMGSHRAAEYTFTTEAETQVQNAGMESWQAWKLDTKYHDVPFYRPWADGQDAVWTTNNDRGTAHRTSGVFGTTYGYNCFPTVSYTLSAYSGKYAAEIRSVGAKNGNTTDICYDESKIPGLLYMGDYAWDDSETITQGKAFGTRPTAVEFYYTYSNYNSDSFEATVTLWSNGRQIGQGVLTSPKGVNTPDYTLARVDIQYTDRVTKADKISIAFRSTNKSTPEVRKGSIDLDFEADMSGNKGWSPWYGSVLRVDEIALKY